MSQIDIFPDTDEVIVCNTPDGQTFEVNIFDLEELIILMNTDVGPEVNRWIQLKKLVDLFFNKYNYKMSTMSMDKLIQLKEEKMLALKKSAYPQLELVDSTESSQEPNESSNS